MSKPWDGDEYSDWIYAFRVAHGGDYDAMPDKSTAQWVVGESGPGLIPFGVDDVEEVLAFADGAKDEESWLMLGKTSGGLFFYMTAWCDYTGWDCQSGGSIYVSRSKERLLELSVTADEKLRMGL